MLRDEEHKIKVNLSTSLRLVHPMHTVLVTTTDKFGKANIITLAWVMPTSVNPPLIAISIAPQRYSHTNIEETKEFVVNIPTMEILRETFFCGRVSGKTLDKFKETGLTPQPAKMVKAPIIKECIAHLECKLHQQFTTGDHTIFIGEIVEAYADKNIFAEKYRLEKAKLIYHLGGADFVTLSIEVVTPRIES